MRVTAAEGLRVPLEGNPRQYIEHDPAQPVDVPNTSYYHRRLLKGELVELPAEAEPQAPAATDAQPAAKPKKGASA